MATVLSALGHDRSRRGSSPHSQLRLGAMLLVDMYISLGQDVHVSEGKKIRWTIASARQNLPTVVGMAAREPQDIYRRDELVARIVSADSPVAQPQAPSAAELIARIQRACADEDYELPVAPRVDRPNPLVDALSPKRKRRKRAKKR